MLSIALVNLKPGTGKTTSAVWLAHAFAAIDGDVLLVDADPAASALEWSDIAGGFPFRTIGLPVRDLHRRIPAIARPDDIVIIDAPQIEDHAGIARGALRFADEILIPVAPTPIEINRTGTMRDEIADANSVRSTPARAAVLLNRTVAHANSTIDAREALSDLGYDVLDCTVPRLEVYGQSFGGSLPSTGAGIWRTVADELLTRAGSLTEA